MGIDLIQTTSEDFPKLPKPLRPEYVNRDRDIHENGYVSNVEFGKAGYEYFFSRVPTPCNSFECPCEKIEDINNITFLGGCYHRGAPSFYYSCKGCRKTLELYREMRRENVDTYGHEVRNAIDCNRMGGYQFVDDDEPRCFSNSKKGWVYFVQMGNLGPIKIGFSKTISVREN